MSEPLPTARPTESDLYELHEQAAIDRDIDALVDRAEAKRHQPSTSTAGTEPTTGEPRPADIV